MIDITKPLELVRGTKDRDGMRIITHGFRLKEGSVTEKMIVWKCDDMTDEQIEQALKMSQFPYLDNSTYPIHLLKRSERETPPVIRALTGNYLPRDYPGDAKYENGNYTNECICGNTFVGHKRRVLCRICASKPAPQPPEQGEGDALLPNQCSHCGIIVEGMSMAVHTCYVCDVDAPPFRPVKSTTAQHQPDTTTQSAAEWVKAFLDSPLPPEERDAVNANDCVLLPLMRRYASKLQYLARQYDEAQARAHNFEQGFHIHSARADEAEQQVKRYDEYHSKLITENESLRAQLAAAQVQP